MTSNSDSVQNKYINIYMYFVNIFFSTCSSRHVVQNSILVRVL